MDLSNLNDIESCLFSRERISAEEFKKKFFLSKDEFQPIDCGHFIVHLSAGEASLSTPHHNVHDSLGGYSHIQIAIEEKSTKATVDSLSHYVCTGKDERFQGFSWRKYFFYPLTDGKTQPSYIGGQVPLKDATYLVKDCYKLSRLKIFF